MVFSQFGSKRTLRVDLSAKSSCVFHVKDSNLVFFSLLYNSCNLNQAQSYQGRKLASFMLIYRVITKSECQNILANGITGFERQSRTTESGVC